MAKETIQVKGKDVRILKGKDFDFICLTDIINAANANPNDTLKNYLRNKGNINFLGVWESVHNNDFNKVGFDLIRMRTGDNNFTLSFSEWVSKTGAIGVKSEKGRYGGTYAHEEIAIQFTTWFSPEFYVYFIKAFKRMAELEKQSTQFFLDKLLTNSLENANLAQSILEMRNLLGKGN